MWFRDTWAWGREKPELKPTMSLVDEGTVKSKHHSLGERYLYMPPAPGTAPGSPDVVPQMIFTDNDTNLEKLYGVENKTKYVKDAFHRYIVDDEADAINPAQTGTKCAAWYSFNQGGGVPSGECAGKCSVLPSICSSHAEAPI